MAAPPQSAPQTLPPGSEVGAYVITRSIGQRGLSTVHEARAPDGDLVLVKLIRPELASDPVFRRRFDRQTRAATSVEHPRIIRILDRGEHGDLPYVVQEHVAGESIADRVRHRGPLSVRETVDALLDVAGALDAMHRAGLIHRAVTSGTLLLGESGGAYISDLGLAKVPQGTMLTRPGQALGSSHYMAPEQIRGDEIGAASDVYGLGCVAYECLCGVTPFADRHGMKVLWGHLQDEPPDPAKHRPELSQGITWAVLRALEKDPGRRPPSATAYARMVQLAADAAHA